MSDKRSAAENAEDMSLSEARSLVRIVIWAALIGVGGWLSIPIPGVPISLQTFFVILAGLVEGPKIGALASGLYLLAGFLGLPVFTGGLGGQAILLRPSAGFALAFPLGAAVAGLAGRLEVGRGGPGFGRAFLLAWCGNFFIYFCGFIGILVNTQMAPEAAVKLLATFVPGDMAKFAAAASLASSPFFRSRRTKGG